jgi:hypothetical protein
VLRTRGKEGDVEAIAPSIEARALFGQMVARSNDELILTLSETMLLYVDRKNAGNQPQAAQEINELVTLGWIEPHASGGWTLYEGVPI